MRTAGHGLRLWEDFADGVYVRAGGCWSFGHEASAGKGLLSGLASYVFGVLGWLRALRGGGGWWGGAILACNARSLALQL